MSGEFYLYVGTDLLVRALSERYIAEEDRRVRTLLRMLSDAGATLVLAEPVLKEVSNHLKTTDIEYRSLFSKADREITLEVARNASKILIRAYFYARLIPPQDSKPPSSWNDYLRQFCSPQNVGKSRGTEELKKYLLATFNLRFVSSEELLDLCSSEETVKTVNHVAEKLEPEKSNAELARNDALMALSVYAHRRHAGETATVSEFGYRTWWLTGETSILKYTRETVRQHGSRYMMRPEFLLNFISMAPSMVKVRTAYRRVFPSVLGVRLASRVREDVFRGMMKKVQEAADVEDGRMAAMISEYSDRLKSDFDKRYVEQFDSGTNA
ncbi:MAG: hypothetical protein AAF735_07525 [Myxococcota bacterium]